MLKHNKTMHRDVMKQETKSILLIRLYC